jgi:hypothetical protein
MLIVLKNFYWLFMSILETNIRKKIVEIILKNNVFLWIIFFNKNINSFYCYIHKLFTSYAR